MKTTLDISDALFWAAKQQAAKERRPLRALVEEGIRSVLAAGKAAKARPGQTGRKKVQWVTVAGGLPEGLDLRNREAMREWLSRGGARAL